MKYRQGFVSNSSSSSFVIQLNKQGSPCPTCGHTPTTIVDLLQTGSHNGYDGNESSIEDLGDYMSELEYELNSTKSFISELQQRDPDEWTYPQYNNRTTKVAQSLKYAIEEQQEVEKRIATFKQAELAGHKMYRLSIEYHDVLAQHIFDENVEQGLITVLEGEK